MRESSQYPSVNNLFPDLQLCPFFLKKELIFFLKQLVMILVISSYPLLSCTVLHEATSLTYITTLLYFPYYSPAKTTFISVPALLCDCSSTLWHLVAELKMQFFCTMLVQWIKLKYEQKKKDEFSYEKKLTLWQCFGCRGSPGHTARLEEKFYSGLFYLLESTGYSLFFSILFYYLC